jgi:uncharacterized protein
MEDFLATPTRQAATLQTIGHRPWPLPPRPWVQGQTWEDLLFAHWRVDSEDLRPHVPKGLPVGVFEGSAWLGITPFRIKGSGSGRSRGFRSSRASSS